MFKLWVLQSKSHVNELQNTHLCCIPRLINVYFECQTHLVYCDSVMRSYRLNNAVVKNVDQALPLNTSLHWLNSETLIKAH